VVTPSSRHDESRSMKLSLYPIALTFAVCGLSPAPKVAGFGTEGTTLSANAPSAHQDVAEETRRKLRHEFGFSFLVYRDKIQSELSLSPEQKAALEKYLLEIAAADMSFLQSIESHRSEFEGFRSKAIEDLDSMLKETLSDAQRKRLGELVRRREGLFGGPSLWAGLQVTDEEKSRFMAVIEPMHKKMEAVAAEAQHRTDPIAFQREVLALRAELESQLEAVLTNSQRELWQQMLGKPIAIEALFDLSNG